MATDRMLVMNCLLWYAVAFKEQHHSVTVLLEPANILHQEAAAAEQNTVASQTRVIPCGIA